eukprot:scaffold17945_cov17-Tisochrysis_lutea.AAC.1
MGEGQQVCHAINVEQGPVRQPRSSAYLHLFMAEDVYTLSFGRRLMQMQLPLLILASQRKPGLDYI